MVAAMKTLLLVPLVVLIAACGAIPGLGGGNDDDHKKLVAYAQCLRGQGINAQDPPPGNNSFHLDARNVPKERLGAAMKACAKYRPTEPPPSAEDLQRMRKLAACLRRNGIEAADPTAAEPGIHVGSPPPGKDIDAISAACQKEVGE